MSSALDQREQTSRPAVPFDDRLWPVLSALSMVALLGGVAIWRVANFEDSRWWLNGWTYEGSLAALTLLLIVGVSLIGRSRRGLQLAAVLSLLVHILLFVSLNQYRLVALAEDRILEQQRIDSVEDFRAPDFHIRAPNDPVQDFEQPVTTDAPEELLDDLARQQTSELEPTPLESKPTPLPGDFPEVQPQIIPLKKLEEAAPRMAVDSSELSRAEASAVDIAEPEPVASPPLEAAAELNTPVPSELPSNATSIERPDVNLSTQSTPASAAIEPLPTDLQSIGKPAESALGPQVPSVTGPLSMRVLETPQVRAPQVADLPRAQSGGSDVQEEPQPLVSAPLRAGFGVAAPQEVGTVADTIDRRVAVRPSAPVSPALSPRVASNRELVGSASDSSTLAPSSDLGKLSKATTGAAAAPAVRLPALSELNPTESTAARPVPAPIQPAPVAALTPSKTSGSAQLPVRVAAPTKQGGLGDRLAPDLGTPNRRASEESQLVDAAPGRLLAPKSGGPLAIDGRSREPAEAFARRGGARQEDGGPRGLMAERTEAAIELGLVFLARHQHPDGSWSLHFAADAGVPDPPPQFRAETAATGLALLSFLGAGYDHYGGAYADVVQRALDDLIRRQRANGDLYRPEDDQANRSAWLYSHGIATIALCEAYGMTGDPALRSPAQKAIDFIVAAQDPRFGAWRYVPGNGSDTSVSGWQLMALKSGELAGLQVPQSAYDRVREWLDGAQTVGSQYVYNPQAANTPQQRHGRVPTRAMTAVGLLMRLYTGLNRNDAHMVEGAEYLLGRLPEDGTLRDPARDTYYWYYATQVMFHMRGKYWNAWNGRLHPLLVDTQLQTGPLSGSWDPRLPVPDRWGPHAGRIYVTTLNLLSLEVYYRHLPLYDSTAQ